MNKVHLFVLKTNCWERSTTVHNKYSFKPAEEEKQVAQQEQNAQKNVVTVVYKKAFEDQMFITLLTSQN